MSTIRTGIMGGTFNPIHNGHISAAEAFRDMLGLDKILFFVGGDPPHKPAPKGASASDRLEMVRLACLGRRGFVVRDDEIRRAGPSYTFDTLCLYRESNPGEELYLYTGSDMLLTFESWKNARGIAQMCVICAAPRRAGELECLRRKAEQLEARLGASVIVLDIPPVEISSTRIREMAANGQDISDYVPAAVYEYIKTHGLYR